MAKVPSRILMEEEEYDYQINLKIEDIRLLHHCVEETFKNWPGAPARPVDEQEHLRYLRQSLYRMMLDYSFHEK